MLDISWLLDSYRHSFESLPARCAFGLYTAFFFMHPLGRPQPLTAWRADPVSLQNDPRRLLLIIRKILQNENEALLKSEWMMRPEVAWLST